MPIVTDVERELLASCRDPLCDGYEQVRVRGVVRTAEFTYGELGNGTASTPHEQLVQNMVERSTTSYVWADPADEPCPACGGPRIIDANKRPVYETKSGQDPLELVKRERGLNREQADRDEALELQRQQLAEAKRSNDLRERELAAAARPKTTKAAS